MLVHWAGQFKIWSVGSAPGGIEPSVNDTAGGRNVVQKFNQWARSHQGAGPAGGFGLCASRLRWVQLQQLQRPERRQVQWDHPHRLVDLDWVRRALRGGQERL